MAIVKFFYGKRIQHCFLSDVVNQIKDDDLELTDVVIIGPPAGEQDNALHNENGEIERMTSDGEDKDVGPPTAQKQC